MCRTVTETRAIGGEAEAGAEGPRLRPDFHVVFDVVLLNVQRQKLLVEWAMEPAEGPLGSGVRMYMNRTSAIVISGYDRFD